MSRGSITIKARGDKIVAVVPSEKGTTVAQVKSSSARAFGHIIEGVAAVAARQLCGCDRSHIVQAAGCQDPVADGVDIISHDDAAAYVNAAPVGVIVEAVIIGLVNAAVG